MNTLTTILIDDEMSATELLQLELNLYCPDVKILAHCNHPEKAKELIQSMKPDFIFLDIEMPTMNGFELLKSMKHLPVEVVFVTAYDRFALKAFEFSALDYLLKPVGTNELKNAIEKVRKRVEDKKNLDRIEALLTNINFLKNGFPNIAVYTVEGIEFIPVKDIIYCLSESNYTQIHLLDGDSIIVTKTLKEVENMLEHHNFLRIHHSYLINLIYLKKFSKKEGGLVIMSNGVQLPVSRSKRNDIFDRFS